MGADGDANPGSGGISGGDSSRNAIARCGERWSPASGVLRETAGGGGCSAGAVRALGGVGSAAGIVLHFSIDKKSCQCSNCPWEARTGHENQAGECDGGESGP